MLVKLPIILAVFVLLLIVTLKLVERYPDPLREGFEEYLSNSYKTNATIGKLETIKFFPVVDIQAENITMHQRSNVAIVQMDIESFKIKAPFWSLFFNTGHIYDLEINNLKANEDFLLPKSFVIENLKMEKRQGPNQYGAFLIAEGLYNAKIISLEAELESAKKGYKISSAIPYALSFSNASLSGEIKTERAATRSLNTVLSFENQTSDAQAFDVFKDNQFLSHNPLYCLLNTDNLKDCKKYLEN